MKKRSISVHATLSLALALLWSSSPVNAAGFKSKNSYLAKAEGYTVKIRASVKYPPMKDNKGSHSGAGVSDRCRERMDCDECPRFLTKSREPGDRV